MLESIRRRCWRPAAGCRRAVRRPLGQRLEPRWLLMADLHIRFDYSYDTSGFFSGANLPRRDLLQLAADSLTDRLADQLTAITPNAFNHWTVDILHPATGLTQTLPADPTIAAGEIVVFAGSRDLPGSVRGVGGGILSAATSYSGPTTCSTLPECDQVQQLLDDYDAFTDSVASRGQPGAQASPATDFAPFVGTIAFDDTDTTWYFDTDPTNFDATSQIDFISIAMHELAHVLGFGVAPSWTSQLAAGLFSGPSSVAAYAGSGNVPAVADHWSQAVGDGQPTLMTPALLLQSGQRQTFSELDFAGLDDLGWNVVAAPPMSIEASFASDQIAEDSAGTELTLRRINGDLLSSLVIAVGGGDAGQLNMPATITIPGGAVERTIVVTPVNDGTAELTKTLSYTFTATGHGQALADIDVLDDEPPQFQNAVDRFNVSGADGVRATDALRIINELFRRRGDEVNGVIVLDPETEQPNGVFLDVNGDYRLTAVDALQVINELRNRDGNGNPLSSEQWILDTHRARIFQDIAAGSDFHLLF